MLRPLPLAVLCACASTVGIDEATAPVELAADPSEALRGGAAPVVAGLSLTATTPHPGGELTMVATNARAGETVGFWSSGGGIAAGQGPCVAQLGGLCLDLGGNTVFSGSAVADAAGRAVLAGQVPIGLQQGATVTFQAAVRRGNGGASSVKSNAAVRTVGAPAWSNTITVDGSLADWGPDEAFDTTSGNNTLGGVTWDATHLYVAFLHPDVATGGAEHWEVVTIGTGGAGSMTGTPLNNQQPGLPFEATLQLRRKADGSYDDLQQWDEAQGQWVGTPFVLGTMGSSAAEAGNVLEIAIPRALLGSSRLDLVLSQSFEGNGFESTYGGVPSDSFVDGFDPDFTTWLELDLSLPDPSGVQN